MVDMWGLLGVGGGPTDPTFDPSSQPINRNVPGSVRALSRLYGDTAFQQALNSINPNAAAALTNIQLDRVRRGVMPLNEQDSLKAAIAGETGGEPTPIDTRDWWNVPKNAVGDLTDIVKSLPRIPGMLADEVRDVADGFQDDREELTKAGVTNPVSQFLSLPGLRMIPGSFVVSNLANGDVEQLAERPLMTALDVLPFATKAASMTKVAEVAESTRQAEILSGRYAPKIRPIRAVLTKTLDEAGELTNNRLGQLLDRAATTLPIRALSDSLGPLAREGIRDVTTFENYANLRQVAPEPGDVLGEMGKTFTEVANNKELLAEKWGLTPEREAVLKNMAEMGDVKSWSKLPANEQRYLAEARRVSTGIGDFVVENMPDQLVKYKDEFYTTAQGNRLARLELDAFNKKSRFFGGQEFRQRGALRDVTGVYDDLVRLAAEDPKWATIQGLVDNGQYVDAVKSMNQMKRFGGYELVSDQAVAKVRTRLKDMTQAERTYNAVMERTAPARFDGLITKLAGEKMIEKLVNQGVVTDVASAYKWLNEGVLDQIPGANRGMFRGEVNAMRRNWQTLRADGADPIFVQRVSPGRANQVGRVKFDGSIPSLQAARERVADISPTQNSLALAISHQAQDVINRQVGQQMAEWFGSKYGVRESTLRQQFIDQAEQLALRDPRYNIDSALDQIMKRKYRPYDPGKLFPFAGAANAFPNKTAVGERIWVPRQVASVIEQANKEGFTRLRVYSDPLTRAYRASLLALSPRWHIYNITGGAVMTGAEVGPGAFKNWRLAWETAKAAKDGRPLPVELPNEIRRVIGTIGHDEAELAFKQGATARFLADNRFFNMGKKVLEKSYDFNQLFDDMYRVMAHVTGEQQALAKYTRAGFDPDAAKVLAQREGIEAARKILQDTAALTPLERSVFRQVVPFYGWLSHLLRFVYQFPLDHPWRAAIVAQAADQVLTDLGSGAPDSMLDQVYFGDRDEEGRQKTFRAGSLNPFSDVGNLFTLAGWLGQSHPLFQTAAEVLGIDPQTGKASMFLEKRYDPATGRQVPDTGGWFIKLAGNLVPQAGGLAGFLGLDPSFTRKAQSDPEAAARELWSAAGIPTGLVPRPASPEEDLAKAEIARQRTQSEALSAALRSGNLDRLKNYPNLDELRVIINNMQDAGALNEYAVAPRS